MGNKPDVGGAVNHHSGGAFWLTRSVISHPIVGVHRPERFAVWCWMLSRARWRAGDSTLNGKPVKLERGQFAASVRFISEATGMSKSALGRFIAVLRDEGMIETDARNDSMVFTIINYDAHQGGTVSGTVSGTGEKSVTQRKQKENQDELDLGGTGSGTVSGTAGGTVSGTNKKKGLEEGLEEYTPHTPHGGFDRFWAASPVKAAKETCRKKFHALVKSGVSGEVIADGMERYAAWLKAMGKRAPKTKYPQGWLTDRRWEDELPSVRQERPSNRGDKADDTVSRIMARAQRQEGRASPGGDMAGVDRDIASDDLPGDYLGAGRGGDGCHVVRDAAGPAGRGDREGREREVAEPVPFHPGPGRDPGHGAASHPAAAAPATGRAR